MKRNKTKRRTVLLLLLVLAAVLSGCAKTEGEEKAGKGFFRDMDFGMTMEEVAETEEGRKDSGKPLYMQQYACMYYEHITWDGCSSNVYYMANADGEHIDTIMINVNGGMDLKKTSETLKTLYTDGSKPEQSDNEYFIWGNAHHIVTAQANQDGTGIVVLMLTSANDVVDDETETEDNK